MHDLHVVTLFCLPTITTRNETSVDNVKRVPKNKARIRGGMHPLRAV